MSHHYNASKNYYYVDRVLRLNCYEYLYKLFNKASSPTKELSEVYGIYKYLIKYFDIKDPDIHVYELGCGVTPRLSGLLVHLTKWTAYAIDPESYYSGIIPNFNRLITFKEKAEDLNIKLVETIKNEDFVVNKILPIDSNKTLIFIFPHAHLNTTCFVERVKALIPFKDIHIIVMPCCFPGIQLLNRKSKEDYRDEFILGEKNRVVSYIL